MSDDVQRVLRLLRDPVNQRCLVQYLPGITEEPDDSTAAFLLAEVDRLSVEDQDILRHFGSGGGLEIAQTFEKDLTGETPSPKLKGAAKVEAYVLALSKLWALMVRGTESQFRDAVLDPETKRAKYPTTLTHLLQFTMVDHDLANTDPLQEGPSPEKLRLVPKKDLLQRKRLLSLLHARREPYCATASASADLDRVVLPSVKLYLKRKNEFVGTAFRWARATPAQRADNMRRLLKECDVLDLRMRFVRDKGLYDRRSGMKHVGDYYRFVLLQRLLQLEQGNPDHVGMAVESDPAPLNVDPRTVVAQLTDLSPGPRRGFCSKPTKKP